MRKVFFLILVGCTVLAQPTSAQWRKIASLIYSIPYHGDSKGDEVYCVYFIPKKPSIGFAAGNHIWRTSDGGKTWDTSKVFGHGIFTEITFKDSLTGWASSMGYACFKTTDGGLTWYPLAPIGDGYSIFYNDSTYKLFLGRYDSSLLVSSNEGESWSSSPIRSVTSFSFSNPSNGILSTWQYSYQDIEGNTHWIDSLAHLYVTTDGGETWKKSFQFDTLSLQPPIAAYLPGQILAIRDTNICYFLEGLYAIAVYRSDDRGRNWRRLYYDTTPGIANESSIRGNLKHLEFSTDSGFFVSEDEGVSWYRVGGPLGTAYYYPPKFYCENGRTICGEIIPGQGVWWPGGLWERDWGMSSVKPAAAIDQISIYPNPTHDRITVGFEAPVAYEVRDVLGVMRLRGKSEGSTAILDLSSLTPGVYYTLVSSVHEKIKTLKVVRE